MMCGKGTKQETSISGDVCVKGTTQRATTHTKGEEKLSYFGQWIRFARISTRHVIHCSLPFCPFPQTVIGRGDIALNTLLCAISDVGMTVDITESFLIPSVL